MRDVRSPAGAPFVLIDDARQGGSARLYRNPREIIATRDPAEVAACLQRLRDAGQRHAAGFIGYEAGYALEPKLAPLARPLREDDPPLLWFGLFDAYEDVDADSWLPDPAGGWATPAKPLIARADYDDAIARTLDHILAGDIYQANLTFQAEARIAGDPRAVYARLRARSRAGHGALVWTGPHWLISLSPELFFTLDGGRLTARPMKGTATRGGDAAADRALAEALAADPKQRAENLMIVDLLRNDLSRVSRPGSVEVPSLFAVETYPTVHQMVSDVTAELDPSLGPIDVIEAIFPCGSVTGAPKIRAMEIIAGLERGPRGPYTGSIGWIAPDGDAAFNVAIRTLSLAAGADRARLGLGSGIVADSVAEGEWRECLAKGAFVSAPQPPFDLIETMRFDPAEGLWELDRHMERMKASAEALGFRFNRHDVRNELQAATFRLREPRLLRLLLSPSGAVAVETRAMPAAPEEPVAVPISALPVDSSDFRLRHKTTDRRFYDDARIASGAFEILFEDADGALTEGSFTNIFVPRDGSLVTPSLDRGLLPGVLRAHMLAEDLAFEGRVTRDELSDGFFIGNAVRGLIAARIVA